MFRSKRGITKKSIRRNGAQTVGKRGFGAFLDKISSYFILMLCLVLTLSLFGNISKVKNVENIIENKKEEVVKAQKEQEELKKGIEYAKSQEYIEKQLRDNLGLAREGETVVVMPPPEVLRSFAPKYQEIKEVLPDPNWKQWMNLFI